MKKSHGFGDGAKMLSSLLVPMLSALVIFSDVLNYLYETGGTLVHRRTGHK